MEGEEGLQGTQSKTPPDEKPATGLRRIANKSWRSFSKNLVDAVEEEPLIRLAQHVTKKLRPNK